MTQERLTEIRRKLSDAQRPFHPPVISDHVQDMADMLTFIDQLVAMNHHEVFVVQSEDLSLETPDFWEAVTFATSNGIPLIHKKTTVLSMASV